MIKLTDKIETIVDKKFIEDNFNVFYSNGILNNNVKTGDKIVFLYSDVFLIPVTISTRSFFHYAHFVTEPAVYREGKEQLKEFLDDVCLYLKKVIKVQWINMNSAASFFFDYPTGSKHIPFGSHVIDLTLDEETLWKNVHSKHRNVIKKSEKDGVEIISGVSDNIIEDYHSIDVETWKRSNVSATGLETLKKHVRSLGDNAIIYMAYLDGKPQSGAFFYFNKQMCYYMYGANCDKPHTGAGNLLQWRAILDMKAMGVKKYSFVGCRINEDENSKYHGIQRFKERFGGELVQGYLFKIEFNPFMRKLFDFAVTFQGFRGNHKWVPFKDVIDQEIHKWPQ